MKVLRKFVAIFDRTNDVLTVIAAVIVIFTMLAVGTDVALGFFLNNPQGWVMETTEFCLLWITFLGTAWLLGKDGHVKLDILANQLSPRGQAMVNTVTFLFGAVVCFIVFWYGTQITWDYFQRGIVQTVNIRLPVAYYLVIIPLGSFLLFIQFLRKSYGYISIWRGKEVLPSKEQREEEPKALT